MYKYINVKNVFTNETEKFILKTNEDGSYKTFPAVDDNPHYELVKEWVSAGNTIEEAD